MPVITGIGRLAGADIREDIHRKPRKTRPRLNRLDRYSRMGFSAVSLALEDAGLDKWDTKRAVGVIAETHSGCLKTDQRFYETVVNEGGHLASPNLFAYTLPTSFIGEAAVHFGLAGPTFALNSAHDKDAWAVKLALTMLASRTKYDAMLCGVCDTAVESRFNRRNPYDAPFALFFVLQNSSVSAAKKYGKIDIGPDGLLTFNGHIMSGSRKARNGVYDTIFSTAMK